ncbi:hypothetical protein [Ornithinimicrobium cerasi]|uniref:hypothetical protein n=1 Tax=Ornithinimicrobium cerasi TaxID=2248773 RepID=UPI000F00417C|nr:hypothetical protein [Ornithinimicrobium cerasi]
MSPNLRAVVGGLVGGLVTAVVCAYATTRVLPAQESLYTPTNLAATAALALGGGVLGVVLGWLVDRRRADVLGRIAAVVTVLGAFAGTIWWVRAVGADGERGLFLVGAVLLLGVSVLGLALASGFTAALLPGARPAAADGHGARP